MSSDYEEYVKQKYPLPWRAWTGKMRPQFPSRIIEVIAADGATVLPWTAFDADGRSYTERLKLARFIALSVNAAQRIRKESKQG